MKSVYLSALFLHAVAVIGFTSNVNYANAQKITTFDPPNSTGTFAVAINFKGQIAGTFTDDSTPSLSTQKGFLRERDGTFATFQPEATVNSQTYELMTWVTDLNLRGEVVGFSLDLSGITTSGFLRRKDGAIVTINGGPSSAASITNRAAILNSPLLCDYRCIDGTGAFAVNALGEITGVLGGITYTGFLRKPDGTTINFAPVSGTQVTSPKSINLFGQITGFYRAGIPEHGFLRQPNGTFIQFDPPNSTDTRPQSINLFSQIAGYFIDSNGVMHGFVRHANGTIVTFDPPGSTATETQSINVLGEITGFYFTADGKGHGFLRRANGDIETFDAPGAGSVGTFPKEINDLSEIAGFYEDGNSVVHGFVRSWR